MTGIEHTAAGEAISARSIDPVLDAKGAVTRRFAERTTMFEHGDVVGHALYIKSGWAMTCKVLPSGTRIVTDFLLHGDMISMTAAEMGQEVLLALTDVVCCEIHDPLTHSSSGGAQLAHVLYMESLKRQARMSERLANMGGRDGLERTGHLLLELAERARHLAKPGFDGFICPLRQADIGDAVGLSTVHANRVLKEMRLKGLVWFRNGIVEFLNRQRLIDIVGFEPAYLSPSIARQGNRPPLINS
ncbi:Crp/Fnr family transcriptional regulator [Rhizobium sp. TH2]|uniref:Crp/Fnr family transcriptional regulator n=1 Tax=Rhizobium sp. TH2 TaxID=2775403 RepID=UPI00215740BB|nr:Crp/Fnr family transcriptional regulator [Rhizobium sp. TH2]UVC07729.1 Crp/Fnr family transcriptional regulator [Rhizobium sp. TH2]